MKKAKLMLSTLAIAAVVASAFAFKAETFNRHIIYTGTLGSGSCTNQVIGAELGGSTGPQVAASIASTTVGCLDKFTQEIDD